MVLVHCTSSRCPLTLYQVSKKIPWIVLELCTGQDNLIKGDNSKSNQGKVMVLVYCNSSLCPLSFYEVSAKSLEEFWSSAPDKSVTDRHTARQTEGRKPLPYPLCLRRGIIQHVSDFIFFYLDLIGECSRSKSASNSCCTSGWSKF